MQCVVFGWVELPMGAESRNTGHAQRTAMAMNTAIAACLLVNRCEERLGTDSPDEQLLLLAEGDPGMDRANALHAEGRGGMCLWNTRSYQAVR